MFFRFLKQRLGLKQLPGYDSRIILAHIGIVLLTYIYLAVLAYEELEKDEQLLITVSTWQNQFIAIMVRWTIRGQSVLIVFKKYS